MSAERNDITDAHRHRRDFYERQWREASARSATLHEKYVEAERALLRAERSRLPVMGEPVKFYSIEEAA